MLRHCHEVHRQSVSCSRGVCGESSLVRDLLPPRNLPLLTLTTTNSRFHKATAPSLIKHFRDCIKGAPRELYANVILTAGPANKDSLVVIQMCYVGPKEK